LLLTLLGLTLSVYFKAVAKSVAKASAPLASRKAAEAGLGSGQGHFVSGIQKIQVV
jgi:hypothetical protein